MEDLRMYILINQDIEIGKGKLAGQVGHAVAVYFYNHWHEHSTLITQYMQNVQKKIILSCSEGKLLELEQQDYIAIRDKGLTQLKPNTLTCVNLGIIDYNDIPVQLEFIKDLKLVR